LAALLTLVKVARTVRDRAHAVAELLPRSIKGPLLRPEQEVTAFFQDIGLAGPAAPRQAEALVSAMYDQIAAIEARLPGRGLGKLLQRRALGALREAVVDLELVLVPERERDCALLGVTRKDDVVAVKSKFRALARRHHPDVPGGDPKRMEELNRAYKFALRMRGAH
jgi:hypothetical protein